jgi:2-polyprenyl-3-methyl-5-hydroxy-6-metoxy-1,4-benzoquinol methylase
MDLKESNIPGFDLAHHWYYKSKSAALSTLLVGKKFTQILDIGAGSGFFSRYLLNKTSASNAVCVDLFYDEESEDFEGQKPIQFRKSISHCEADLVILMDVLEHVDDDVGLLSEYVALVPSGATFVISVPAFNFMWSDHDVFLEHKRRYTITELEATVRKSNLEVQHSAYFFGFVFPLAMGTRLLKKPTNTPKSQLKNHHPLVNWGLNLICHLELVFFKFNRLAGLTVFCLAKKP